MLKGIRALGMSDPPRIADLLSEKFDYTNTFYHQAPRFDVLHPEPGDLGRYDFVISSEVMKHVPPPVETGFTNLYDISETEKRIAPADGSLQSQRER